MYESPIQLFTTDITTKLVKKQEEHILKAVQSVAVGIDHEELFRALRYDRDQYEKGYQDAIRERNLVEVVRCKDCKNWEIAIGSDGTLGYCELDQTAYGLSTTWYADDFCSYGERKDND